MKRPEPLDIFQPTSARAAIEMIKKNGPGGYLLAGGTDLIIAIKEKGLVPRYLVDLKRIPSLSGIRESADGTVTLGALTTLREIETSPLILRNYPFLAQSAAEVGSIQIRNRATVGGNMANATPSADVAPALLALDARARIEGPRGEKTVPLEGFFVGPGKTVLTQGEILKELMIPPPAPKLRGDYIKFSPREMMDLAVVGVAIVVVLDRDEQIGREARIALGAVAPVPMRAKRAEVLLQGQPFSAGLADRVGEEAARECKPISDVRGSAEYRREMVRAMTKRILMNLWSDKGQRVPWIYRRERRYP